MKCQSCGLMILPFDLNTDRARSYAIEERPLSNRPSFVYLCRDCQGEAIREWFFRRDISIEFVRDIPRKDE